MEGPIISELMSFNHFGSSELPVEDNGVDEPFQQNELSDDVAGDKLLIQRRQNNNYCKKDNYHEDNP